MYNSGKSLDITYFEDTQITLLLGAIHKGKHQSDLFFLMYFKIYEDLSFVTFPACLDCVAFELDLIYVHNKQ